MADEARRRLVLYPTVYEGFGLVPFEAAGHGVPCMWAAGTSLSEILPEAAATIVPWDAAATADVAFELMSDQSAPTGTYRLCARLRRSSRGMPPPLAFWRSTAMYVTVPHPRRVPSS